MIPFSLLTSIASKLVAFRGDGRTNILFDARDQGNYGAYHWDETAELLTKADPTGFSLALLINEMIEATINGSKVMLSRILREPGFTEQLHHILDLKDELMTVLEAPMSTFHQRIEYLINEVSPNFGNPTSLEIALAMRDAIYCISEGMSVRWILCEQGANNFPVGLQNDIVITPTLADFVQELRHSLPYGVHLGRVGRNNTVIGIKKPGRIAYMSSMKVDARTGGMTEEVHRSANLSEKFDLDGFAHRYPRWHNTKMSGGFGSHPVDTDAKITSVSQVSRDTMIWLAMMMELANQQMGRVDPAIVKLSESARMAITHGASERNTLPVPYTPSWVYQPPALAEVLNSLGLSEWELKFLAPALHEIDPLDFIPVSESTVGYHFIEKRLTQSPDRVCHEWWIRFVSISEGIAGTQEEVQAVVRKIYQKNLANYLISWGNRTFAEHWRLDRQWFTDKLTDNALKAMDAACSHVRLNGFERWNVANVFKQSPKHKGFKPVCFITGKGDCDVKTHVYPQTDDDIVEVLGLASKDELPAYLHGWSRDLGWTTSDFFTDPHPGITDLRWYFACDKDGNSDDPESSYEGVIYFNSANHPTGAKKTKW